jgi:hypothetical protein
MLEKYGELKIRGILGEAAWRSMLRALDDRRDEASRIFPKKEERPALEDQEC